MVSNVAIAVAVALVVLVLFLRKKNLPANIPPVVGKIPVLGCFIDFAKSPMNTIRRSYDQLGDCFTLSFFGRRITFMVGPDAQATFFRASDEELSPKEAYQFMVPVFGPGVVYDSPTEVMHEQLRFVKNGLVTSQLKKAVGVMSDEARNFFETRWGDSGTVDLLEDLNKLTILTASRCLMGEDIRKHLGQQERFAQLYHDLEAGITPITYFFPRIPIPSVRQRDRARGEVAEIFRTVIQYRRAHPDEERDDILSVLMESTYKDGSTLDDEQMIGIMIGLLFAGQHTSSITATWLGLLLHQPENKIYLDEVKAEHNELHKEFAGDLNFDYLKKANKLENSVREVLRMYPPLIILMRMVHTPMKYKNYEIPAGDLMAVSPGVGMRVPEAFTNPDKYDPHRFERNEHNAKPFNFIGFGGGRHGCPGENFGILQIKTIWSVLLEKYDFELTTSVKPTPDYTTMVVGPQTPCMIRYKKKASK
eukprot:TRINITY_DN863_c0_g1_i3.p1 TRINITY_DN863_c0_g1~~TRINITY_DN863_c0_g1_i3.p1  ORF type:complete len:511 (+),score=144.53 TRINITY_DN863_c0_g1_i3:105-1535(+)